MLEYVEMKSNRTAEAGELRSDNLRGAGKAYDKSANSRIAIILGKGRKAKKGRKEMIAALERRLKACECKELEQDMPKGPLSELPDRVIKLILALDILSDQPARSRGSILRDDYVNCQIDEEQVLEELHTIMSPEE